MLEIYKQSRRLHYSVLLKSKLDIDNEQPNEAWKSWLRIRYNSTVFLFLDKTKFGLMSFKLFSMQLRGKIKPVESIEKRRESLQHTYDEFIKAEKSDELKRYIELEATIASEDFKRKKNEIRSLGFKGSEEYNQLKEFESLKKARNIKTFFKVDSSSELKKFNQIQKEEKLTEYFALLEYMKEGQFQKDKKEIVSQVYKGSVEQQHMLDFKKLERSPGIKAYLELNDSKVLNKHQEFSSSEKLKRFNDLKNSIEKKDKDEFKRLKRDVELKNYFRFEKSKKLRLYHETKTSYDLKRYFELKEYVQTNEFKERTAYLKDSKKFEKSEAWKKSQDFKRLKGDSDIRFFLRFEKSSPYKKYLDVKESFQLKRYRELDELIQSKEYQDRKAYLEDTKKWEKTEEYALEQEFSKLKGQAGIQTYFAHKDTDHFDEITKWESTFSDDFSGVRLDSEKWSTMTKVASKTLGENYTLPGDLHTYTNGNNIKLQNKLVLSVKSEKATGKVWQMPAGFVPTEFNYTSDRISTWDSFGQEDGIFEAKIRFTPQKEVLSSLFLSGENDMPRINLLQMGTKNMLGVASLVNGGKLVQNGLDISNLKSGKWYIFTFVKEGRTLSWKINEKEVLQLDTSEFSTPLHLNASSLVVNEIKSSAHSGNFEIEWVKCRKKS